MARAGSPGEAVGVPPLLSCCFRTAVWMRPVSDCELRQGTLLSCFLPAGAPRLSEHSGRVGLPQRCGVGFMEVGAGTRETWEVSSRPPSSFCTFRAPGIQRSQSLEEWAWVLGSAVSKAFWPLIYLVSLMFLVIVIRLLGMAVFCNAEDS